MIEAFNGLNTQQLQSWKSVIPELGKKQAEVLKAILDMSGEASVEEISKRLDRPRYVVAPRVTELNRKSILEDSGKTRKAHETGRNETVWRVRESVEPAEIIAFLRRSK